MAQAMLNPTASSSDTANGSGVVARGLSMRYERVIGRERVRTSALDDVSFDIRPQEFVSIIGPSGCGKSTVVRI
ncbi:MAG: NitT/TauT family transport system ATP-binding protein, partial [Baekduia sp.]|nr:NitT/TauT family transport system ATP-binding protein [Baekduia sp.]